MRKLSNIFAHHSPSTRQVPKYVKLRSAALKFAETVEAEAPACRERDIAVEKIREAVMWANAAVACSPELPVVTLTRGRTQFLGTLGEIKVVADTTFSCSALELPWRDNTRNISCIPVGQYRASMVNSPRNGRVYELAEVPGRGHIQFHAGNFLSDTEGCVLLGDWHTQHSGKKETEHKLLDSRKALSAFHEYMGGRDFLLVITEGENIGEASWTA